MRYIVVIILAVLLAGCDDPGTCVRGRCAPAALGSAGGGRGRYAGRCWKLQNDGAIVHLGANAGFAGSTLGGPSVEYGMYTIWAAAFDAGDENAWQGALQVFVKDAEADNFWKPKYASMRVCADHQIVPCESGVHINCSRSGLGDPNAEWYIGYYR